MQVKLVIIPNDNGLNVLVWGKWTAGSMRVRHFENRTEMATLLLSLGLITTEDANGLENFAFTDSCPLFSAEIEEEILGAHGFKQV